MSNKPEPIVFETFTDIGPMTKRFREDEPSHINNDIRVQRYRVTIEVIDEPDEVIRDRLLALDAMRGHVDKGRAIRAEAKRLGIDLKKG